MANITIIGLGAIGGTVAAWLAQDPRHRITLAARTTLDRLEVHTPQGVIMEIDARNGVIVRLGGKHGIPTPLNALCVGLLEAAQG